MYRAKISDKDVDFEHPDGVKALQKVLDTFGIDRVKDKQGRVFTIGGRLAKKSVPIAPGQDNPKRINFTSVISFGTEVTDKPTEYATAMAAGDEQKASELAEQAIQDKATMLAMLKPWEEAQQEQEQEQAQEQEPVQVEEASPTEEPRAHAVLSASGANRWLHCPPSAQLEAQLPEQESPAAAEGTAAHNLGEHKIRRKLKQRSNRPTSEYNDDDMEDYTDAYADYVFAKYEEAKQADPGALIALEQRLDFSHFVPDGFGTGDALIAQDGVLEIIDLKYGAGVLVDAYENPQMKLYALGALAAYDMLFDFEEVRMTIYQPRRDNISTFTMSVEELTQWGEQEVKPRAEIAAAGGGDFAAGDWCMFCKLKPTCRARADAAMAFAQWEFEDPTELTEDEIAQALKLIPLMRSWANDLEKYALTQAVEKGQQWQGMKLVAGRAVRKYTDPDKVAEIAKAAGYTDIYDQKLLTLTKMEKLMGKQEFSELLGEYIYKPEGKPTLVPENDRRPALAPRDAASEFEN